MVSVTCRIGQISQPRGGYLSPKAFEIISMNDDKTLSDDNIHSSLIGLTVDYLTRFNTTKDAIEAFKISSLGAHAIDQVSTADRLIEKVSELDDDSIIAACKLSGFDVCYRSGPAGFKPVEEINPDKTTINNIRIMVNRSLKFIEEFGPIVEDGFTFPGGYTSTVNTGDGDYLTSDTLWDFKVSKNPPTNKNTLQLLMYYIMGLHSVNPHFKTIKKLGVFNPRLNKVYRYDLEKLDKSIITDIEEKVIRY